MPYFKNSVIFFVLILITTSVGAKKALSNKAAQEMPPLVEPMTATAGRRR